MRSLSEVGRDEPLPEGGHPLVPDDLDDHVGRAPVLRDPGDHLHVLDPGLGDVDRHGDADGDDAAQHGRDEVGRGTLGNDIDYYWYTGVKAKA